MGRDELWPFFLELSRIAAAVTLPAFRDVMLVENKAGDKKFDPVTVVDWNTEEALIAQILSRYPNHSILAEESGVREGSDAWTWVIDPIDGTRSYISGLPTWGTLIGLLHHDVPSFGMMSQPFVKDCFIGGDGVAELIRPDSQSQLAVREYCSLEQATLFTTSPEMFVTEQEINSFSRLSDLVKLTRFGADCYGYCLLAAGCADLVVEADLQYYDIAPVIPIVESAGGVVSDWQGKPVRQGGRAIAATSRKLLDEALIFLKDVE